MLCKEENTSNYHQEPWCQPKLNSSIRKIAGIAKVVSSFEHITVSNEREEWNYVIIFLVTLTDAGILRIWGVGITLEPLFQYAVNHCMVVYEDGIIGRSSNISHHSFVFIC